MNGKLKCGNCTLFMNENVVDTASSSIDAFF